MTEFENLVHAMRDAQKRYFKKRCRKALEESKYLEQKVDRYLAGKTPVEQQVSENQLKMPLT
jgi:hypothetical protein